MTLFSVEFFAALIIGFIIVELMDHRKKRKAREAQELVNAQCQKAMEEALSRCNGAPVIFDDGNMFLCVDEEERLVHFYTPESGAASAPSTSITGCEIRRNGNTVKVGGYGDAMIGGIFGGDAGAVVGASLSPQSTAVTRYDLAVQIADTRFPRFVYHLVTQTVNENSAYFVSAQDFAERVYDTICAITAQNQKAQVQVRLEAAETESAPAEDAPMKIEKVVCPKCGSIQPASGKFCSECGQRLAGI